MNSKNIKNGMHINLLLKNKKCLIIGGGKVALHKIGLLLDAEAEVHVISPDLHPKINKLKRQKKIKYLKKEFECNDICGAFLVYAATNSRKANQEVLDACRLNNILCCCVDGNWASGDFITPATTKHEHLTVSISSGGTSCRQSKLVKNSLSKQISYLQSAHLIIIGTDHNYLDVSEREKLYLPNTNYKKIGSMISQILGIHEFMILNTCNRSEIIAVISSEAIKNNLILNITGFSALNSDKFYIKKQKEAFEHLCLVASGMLSQTPGENHITSQIKSSMKEAKSNNWADNMLQEWISSALFISKEIKNEVSKNMHTEEISPLTFRYLRSKNKDNSSIMIIGTGFLGKDLIIHAIKNFSKIIWCYNSNKPSPSLLENKKIKLIDLKNINKYLSKIDLIISAANSDEYILSSKKEYDFSNRDTLIIDLSVPRAIDPAITSEFKNIEIINLDNLKEWNRSDLAYAYDYIEASRVIIKKHTNLYEKITHNFQGRN